MKKNYIGFGGGADSIFFSIKENKFFSFEMDEKELFQKYGGKRIYTSCSGSTCEAYIDHMGDLIEFGYYRTDARNEQGRKTVFVSEKGTEIFGYAPYISHGGIDRTKPFILTDGTVVVFSPEEEIKDWLLAWDKWDSYKGPISLKKGKIFQFTNEYYSPTGKKFTKTWALVNFSKYGGVRATRFIDLRSFRFPDIFPENNQTLLSRNIGIKKFGSLWLHQDNDGVYDALYDTNPYEIVGKIEETSWEGFGNGIFWTRNQDNIEVFVEMPRKNFDGGKWCHEVTPTYIDFERSYSVLEFFSKTEEIITEEIFTSLRKKALEDLRYARRNSGEDTLKLLRDNTDNYLCIKDSLAVGNCLPGTENFISQYGIKLNETGCIKIHDLLDNPRIMEMIKSFNFQKVVYKKLEGEEIRDRLEE